MSQLSRRSLLATISTALAATLFGSIAAKARPLRSQRWKHRPLLVFAPSSADPRLAQQRALLETARAGLAERDMTVTIVAGNHVSALLAPAARGSAASVRKAYRVDADAFAVLLVGKDGGVKLRSATPVVTDRLFALIDAMPMRRNEMRRRQS